MFEKPVVFDPWVPPSRHMSDAEVEQSFVLAQVHVAAAKDAVARSPGDPQAHATLERVSGELAAALALRAQRQGQPR